MDSARNRTCRSILTRTQTCQRFVASRRQSRNSEAAGIGGFGVLRIQPLGETGRRIVAKHRPDPQTLPELGVTAPCASLFCLPISCLIISPCHPEPLPDQLDIPYTASWKRTLFTARYVAWS